MPGSTTQPGKSSYTGISAHVASFDGLGTDIARIESSDSDQNHLISSAQRILDNFSKAECRFMYGPGDPPPSIELDKVLSAMLSHAQDCGGQEGLRYFASAIVACHERGQSNGGDAVETNLLESMAITMITQFLFIFKAKWPESEDWLGATFDYYDPRPYTGLNLCGRHIPKSEERFRLKLVIRQAFECFISGYGSPCLFSLDSRGLLIPRQIFRWPTGIAEDGSESSKSATRSFNILKKFTRISANNLGELKNIIHDPSNGVLMMSDLLEDFAQFEWWLQPTNAPNDYSIQFYGPPSGALQYFRPDLNAVVFADRSETSYSMDSTLERFPDPIPLPDRHLISICAGIGEILHGSGAGPFLDKLLPASGNSIAVHSWQELEELPVG
ncbi:hypothetical protein M413DRAFT_443125 [Hebeloma cylindrosporum]|uniref:HNH nuclease domain-containing protein n=1 Tax=Hebeloma cylindrosporum TaxID=76867 RepID=A0A0C3C5D3_HEBCY|nr:hypothetical protein M413DRAFT_443125 [Hebeloma cylindrosporum h7]